MSSRAVASLSMLAVAALAGCGTSSDSGTPTGTTVKLGTPTYVTITIPPPSTVPPPPPGAIVTTEQQYTVQTGDYLLGIAKTFCLEAQQIADFNGWVEGITRSLTPGMTITIPPNACPPGGSASTLPATSAPLITVLPTVPETTTTFNAAVGGPYTVQDGDTLTGIASKFGTNVESIVIVNEWDDGARHVIYQGLVIQIPPVN